METSVLEKKKHTYQDYLQTDEGSMYQLIEGQLVKEPSAPYIVHQEIVENLHIVLAKHVKENKLGKVHIAPVDVYFDEHNCLQPDLLFISKERLGIIKESCVKGAPELVIEILSNWSVQRDMIQKKALYEKFGVKEYWIVHPNEQLIEVFVLKKHNYTLLNVFAVSDTLTSMVLNGLKLKLSEIFNDK